MVVRPSRGIFLIVWLLAALSVFRADAADRLVDATSPYLRQHAPDLVDWRPWGEAALAEAKALDRPILLSIGYSACHWCHVMQRESYQDAETAAFINGHFVPILIDREERPDLDATFQAAAQIRGWQTGWPLTLFLTAGGTPFFGGAYFPKETMMRVPAFSDVLAGMASAYRSDPSLIEQSAAASMTALRCLAPRASAAVSMDTVDRAARTIAATVDRTDGGFVTDGPKFPEAVALTLLWRAYLRTGDTGYRDAVVSSLRAMVLGSLYDQVGGGFFRYTIEPKWRIPHFEKMLDVNAALLGLLTEVWRETRDPEFERAIRGTATFLIREMRLDGGGFAASLDADSLDEHGEEAEGAFYVWPEGDLDPLLGPDAAAFWKAFGLAVTSDGDVLFRVGPLNPAVKAVLPRLLAHREARPRPHRDDKLLADWNALTIAALAEAGTALNRPGWIAVAEAAFSAVAARADGDSGFRHSWYRDLDGPPALLRDLGGMAGAGLVLFEATGKADYLERARAWAGLALGRHRDETAGGFFATATEAGPMPLRTKPYLDDPDPSGNALIAEALARLSYQTGEAALRKEAARTLTAFGQRLSDGGRGVAGLLNALETFETGLQIVIVGRRGEADTETLLGTVFATSLPTRSLQAIAPGASLPEGHPAWNKGQEDGKATAYVCRGTVCSLPVTTAGELAETLRLMRRG